MSWPSRAVPVVPVCLPPGPPIGGHPSFSRAVLSRRPIPGARRRGRSEARFAPVAAAPPVGLYLQGGPKGGNRLLQPRRAVLCSPSAHSAWRDRSVSRPSPSVLLPRVRVDFLPGRAGRWQPPPPQSCRSAFAFPEYPGAAGRDRTAWWPRNPAHGALRLRGGTPQPADLSQRRAVVLVGEAIQRRARLSSWPVDGPVLQGTRRRAIALSMSQGPGPGPSAQAGRSQSEPLSVAHVLLRGTVGPPAHSSRAASANAGVWVLDPWPVPPGPPLCAANQPGALAPA